MLRSIGNKKHKTNMINYLGNIAIIVFKEGVLLECQIQIKIQ